MQTLTDGAANCANVPRTFLNADTCVLSSEPYTCGSTATSDGVEIEIDDVSIKALSDMSGRYLYAIVDLPVVDAFNTEITHPCTGGWRSRWEMQLGQTCSNATVLGATTLATLTGLLSVSTDPNVYMRDVEFPTGGECDVGDTNAAIEIQVGSDCFVHAHQDWNSVYDMTSWVDRHPGGAHAITKWADVNNVAYLSFPAFGDFPHPTSRWGSNKDLFPKIGRYGDSLNFRDVPDELKIETIAEYFGATADAAGTGSVMVCGSHNEVANDPTLGAGFKPRQNFLRASNIKSQKQTVWTMTAMSAPDQFRQRIAWALSQVLVVVMNAVQTTAQGESEAFLGYYDIFVRHAFGNFRDVLKVFFCRWNVMYVEGGSNRWVIIDGMCGGAYDKRHISCAKKI